MSTIKPSQYTPPPAARQDSLGRSAHQKSGAPLQTSDSSSSLSQLMRMIKQTVGRHDSGLKISDLAKQEAGRQGQLEEKEVFTVRDGKLVKANSKMVKQEAQEGKLRGEGQRELSSFEKAFVRKFREAKQFGEALLKGKFVFGKKEDDAWSGFFGKMRPYEIPKKIPKKALKEMIFRGFYKGAIVSDLKMQNGKLDKFTRIQFPPGQLPQKFQKLSPGDIIAVADLTIETAGQEFEFTALSHKPVISA